MPDGVTINVQLHTILQKETPEGPLRRLDIQLPPGENMADLLLRLQVKLSPETLLLVVNGRLVDLDYQFRDGDAVSLMPALSGGS